METVCSKNGTEPSEIEKCQPMDCQFAVSYPHNLTHTLMIGELSVLTFKWLSLVARSQSEEEQKHVVHLSAVLSSFLNGKMPSNFDETSILFSSSQLVVASSSLSSSLVFQSSQKQSLLTFVTT